ncbi:NUDIX domain-containing protein [Candidatus Woesearchaeota archaeon]|nr:NUDIX domain-containing protein [Candidatus Woesearchaeota archaeon]
MGDYNSEIMVVRKDDLFSSSHFVGFLSKDKFDYESIICKNHIYMIRKVAESNPHYKQPIGFALIVNPETRRVFVYQRATKDEDYREKGLQGKWSIGVGGHIEKSDIEEERDPIKASLLRELKEEVYMDGKINQIVTLGYINYEEEKVQKVHFGVLYLVETNSRVIKPNDPEIATGELKSIEDLIEMNSSPEYDFEEWAKIAIEPLKKIL